jgi:hypothetical protein
MACKLQQELDNIEISETNYIMIQHAISSSANVHRWINQGASESDLLRALKVELETSKRYAIVKRLHQKYTKLRSQDEFNYFESILV